MPLFGRRADKPTQAELDAAQVDLERIREGGIPLGAEQRLQRVAADSEPFFTSDLSSKQFALADSVGLAPVAQVMGSSVVKHGWAYNQYGWYGGINEVPGMSEPWNLARGRAFDRLAQEAACAAADGVIGVQIESRGTVGEADNVEFIAFGTAVRDRQWPRREGQPLRLCSLSGQDVDKLRRIGAEVVGVVSHTSVVSSQLGYGSNWVMNSRGWFSGRQNVEIPEISAGVYYARQNAMGEVQRQAQAVGANDLVITTLSHSIRHHEYGDNNPRHYFIVTMHVLGTAVVLGAHEPRPGPLGVPRMSINLGKPNN
ncbi:MAG: heavy metal-binding domain-containing protein [Solirubrobacterales bacterium]|nr:heavy metal-binding domain-containing protein [Solirubrobacterales bacterium]